MLVERRSALLFGLTLLVLPLLDGSVPEGGLREAEVLSGTLCVVFSGNL